MFRRFAGRAMLVIKTWEIFLGSTSMRKEGGYTGFKGYIALSWRSQRWETA